MKRLWGARRMITYSRGSAALYRLPDGKKVLVEISPRDNRATLHKVNFLGHPTKTLWQYDFPLPVADRSELAVQILDELLSILRTSQSIGQAVGILNTKVLDSLNAQFSQVSEEGTRIKKCPYCAEMIAFEAVKCKHCGEFLAGPARAKPAVERSGCTAAFLSFLFPPLGLWYKRQWLAGFAWLIGGIVAIYAIGYLAAPIVVVGSIIHAAAAETAQ